MIEIHKASSLELTLQAVGEISKCRVRGSFTRCWKDRHFLPDHVTGVKLGTHQALCDSVGLTGYLHLTESVTGHQSFLVFNHSSPFPGSRI